jgi:hypothetical protein
MAKPKSVFEEIENGTISGSGTPGDTVAPAASPLAALSALPQANLNDGTVNLLVQVLTLMAQKESRTLAQEEQERKNNAQRDAQRVKNAQGQEYERISKQAKCRHRKGGTGVKDTKIDFCVGTHTYPDNTCIITCLLCKAKWRNGDTREYFLRKGRKIANHTHVGWQEAVDMYNNSSNSASKSEIDPNILRPNAATTAKSGTVDPRTGDNQVRDIDGNVVQDYVL